MKKPPLAQPAPTPSLAPKQGAQEQTDVDGGIPAAWPDSTTGEGAASALESLRKLEQKRHDRPPGSRPESDPQQG